MKDFNLVLIKPSHYDDDGYVIQWWRSAMPSNTLASVVGLAQDVDERQVLGPDVRIRIHAIDETNTRVSVKQLARKVKNGNGLIGIVGVQSNQYPRALHMAKQFRELDVSVAIGGFHVSGCIAMLPEMPTELTDALNSGITLYAGEAEERFDEFMLDAYHGRMKPLYNYMEDLPDISHSPIPFLEAERVKRTAGDQASFDAGRGCPFSCSFCTIINVQGRKSRYRLPEEVAMIVKRNLVQGVKRFFITDDNFARNQNWEPILDALIKLRKDVDIRFNLSIQVDTLCHKIPNFIDKCAEAGVKRAFLGLENINPDNLKSAKKRQNRITEYRSVIQAWKNHKVFTVAGYILGFPNDTRESILKDIEIVKKELPIDLLEFFYLTPLPGSEDHKVLWEKQVPIDGDLNKYDLCHATFEHQNMTRQEWEKVYIEVHDSYYSDEHAVTLLRRARATGIPLGKMVAGIAGFYGNVVWEGIHPLEAGIFRRKYRLGRRPELPVESVWKFYPEYARQLVSNNRKYVRRLLKFHKVRRDLERDPETKNYTDLSLTPVQDDEIEVLELFNATESAHLDVEKEIHRRERASAKDDANEEEREAI
jgi:radical SAM superfamily enzyme YgiQ (UPF0313 family)